MFGSEQTERARSTTVEVLASHGTHMQHDNAPLLPPDGPRQFAEMLQGYRTSGGVVASPELLALCGRHSVADVALLARWIVERSVVCFEWQSQTWFPLFQFRPPAFAPSQQLQPLLTQLAQSRNAWQVAHWLIVPSRQLGGREPLALLDIDASAVLRAARCKGTPAPEHPASRRMHQSA